jgi:hypothetical protein
MLERRTAAAAARVMFDRIDTSWISDSIATQS